MALGRSLDAAEQDEDEATAARPLVTVPIARRQLGGRRAQHPASANSASLALSLLALLKSLLKLAAFAILAALTRARGTRRASA